MLIVIKSFVLMFEDGKSLNSSFWCYKNVGGYSAPIFTGRLKNVSSLDKRIVLST